MTVLSAFRELAKNQKQLTVGTAWMFRGETGHVIDKIINQDPCTLGGVMLLQLRYRDESSHVC